MRTLITSVTLLLMASAAVAQEQSQQLSDNQAIPGLMLFTLFAALAIGVGALLLFLRKRSNRAAMKRALDE